MDERNSSELILTLGEDFKRCYASVLKDVEEGEKQADGTTIADHEFNARQLVRAGFAYIEGVSFSLKVAAIDDAIENGVNLTQAEIDFAFEVSHQLNDKGDIVKFNAHISLTKNIKFAFNLYSKAHELNKSFDAGLTWWSDLKKAIKVRDRLMHPRTPEDLDIAPSEVVTVISAVRGFESLLFEYFGNEA
ncbi:hypothetical protein [Vreelandella gomseomensis]|uniref:RiboL-PSP-HEPN domain-containing protein n=1 Tax=Vreelandella gomseomensis TaxID=370766 RepID=A0ABU1G8H9_9GAMM|nr:hypothetical protein [Halomonas gomseomensis]MDR5873801.1 hypothetical protein [Halomonas gomseomensis]